MNTAVATFPKEAMRLMAAAPHRLLFLVGAANVLAAMSWWAGWLVAARFGVTMPQPALPAGWMHAVIMQYQVLPSFIFGFLLTVFPRWLGAPALGARHYLPVGIGLLGGQLLTLAGLAGHPALLQAGALLTLMGWSVGTLWLARVLVNASTFTWHAVSALTAVCFGIAGLVCYSLLLRHLDGAVATATLKLGIFGALVPIYFTVCHRMIPFFTGNVVPGYELVRPNWTLGLAWALVLAHLGLELAHAYAWTWVVDIPLVAIFTGLLIVWWPRARMPALLRVLFLGFAWLPIAFALYALQGAWFAATGEFALGRAPAHALFVGFFGSLLVAMVTRVTQGHSGRPLVLGKVAAFAFVVIQLVTVTRIVSELAPDALGWQAAAAVGWIVAFLPWVLRSAWIYLSPRVDGHPG